MTVFDIHSLKKTLVLPALIALFSIALYGCNTTAGFGADVEAAGEAIEGKAKEEKGY